VSRNPATPALGRARVGDARALTFGDGLADAVILHGPLYHLIQRSERLRAIEEARRVLRAGGLEHETTLGVLGPAWMVPDLDASWADEARRQVILDVAQLTEDEPVWVPRLMTVARKPTR
jgi:SAM-dependent methyltransferase